MKLKEFLKLYYDEPKDVTIDSLAVSQAYRDLVLPGTFSDFKEFRKLMIWNLNRDVYYREAYKVSSYDDNLFTKMTTGIIELYPYFENEKDFQTLLSKGLKKHRHFRKERLMWSDDHVFMYYQRKYE